MGIPGTMTAAPTRPCVEKKPLHRASGLFDSQNNAASGYQIGDDCKPACKAWPNPHSCWIHVDWDLGRRVGLPFWV